tara:strand:- start:6835 stop:7401 length:567 start_codon:yes stop_codon:yes gene_type:complete
MTEENTPYEMIWWQQLHLDHATLKQKKLKPHPTSYKAQLKRCRTPDEVVATEAFRTLWLRLPKDKTKYPHSAYAWAAIAGVMAHVKKDKKSTEKIKCFASSLGEHDGDKPIVSPLRFKQLSQSRSVEAFYSRMIRTVHLIKGETFVKSLMQDMNKWFDEFHFDQHKPVSERLAVRWAMDYYDQFPLTK